MNKQERELANKQFAKLTELPSPDWLSKDVYKEFLEKRDSAEAPDMYSFVSKLINTNPKSDQYHIDSCYNSFNIVYSPKFLYHNYMDGHLISPPDSGQDPKIGDVANLKIASNHAANQWGFSTNGDPKVLYTGAVDPATPSLWINYGVFNVIQIGERLCIVPIDVEHRNWGLVGFPHGCVPMGNPVEPIYFYHNDLPQENFCSVTNRTYSRIKINGLYLQEIVRKCHEKGATQITDMDIKNRFWDNDFKFTFLPSYSRLQTEDFFRRINDVSKKKAEQLFHAESIPNLYWIKDFSSVKVTKFKASGKELHELFELMTPKQLVSLDSMMIAVAVGQYNVNGKELIHRTSSKLIPDFKKTQDYSDEMKGDIKSDLVFVYSLVSKYINETSSSNMNISIQLVLNLIHIRNQLAESYYVIHDKTLFINEFQSWFEDVTQDSNNKKNITTFQNFWANSGMYEDCYKYIFKNFLKKMDEKELKKIGVVQESDSLPRLYSGSYKKITLESYKENDKKDIDGNRFVYPVGGHIISDMELLRMTTNQRNQAFKEEGLGDEFDFKSNCRAMSKYHNSRMSVLRLSEYMKIIDESDDVVKLKVQEKFDELKSMDILV